MEICTERRTEVFCLGVNDQVDKFEDYIFSLECDEKEVEKYQAPRTGTEMDQEIRLLFLMIIDQIRNLKEFRIS